MTQNAKRLVPYLSVLRTVLRLHDDTGISVGLILQAVGS